MLGHHADAQRNCITRRANLRLPAVDPDLALIGMVQAVENAHERAFACTIFAQQRVNLALAEREIHMIIGHQGAEAFGDPAHLYSLHES